MPAFAFCIPKLMMALVSAIVSAMSAIVGAVRWWLGLGEVSEQCVTRHCGGSLTKIVRLDFEKNIVRIASKQPRYRWYLP